MNETRCPLCGKGKLREDTSEFRSHFIDDAGARRDVIVPNVLKLRCDTCGEYIIDPDSESRISVAQREALGLLGAADLQQLRRRLNMSQEDGRAPWPGKKRHGAGGSRPIIFRARLRPLSAAIDRSASEY